VCARWGGVNTRTASATGGSGLQRECCVRESVREGAGARAREVARVGRRRVPAVTNSRAPAIRSRGERAATCDIIGQDAIVSARYRLAAACPRPACGACGSRNCCATTSRSWILRFAKQHADAPALAASSAAAAVQHAVRRGRVPPQRRPSTLLRATAAQPPPQAAMCLAAAAPATHRCQRCAPRTALALPPSLSAAARGRCSCGSTPHVPRAPPSRLRLHTESSG
jgi:hypothetical protein